jgi:nucleolar protein 14
VRAAPHRERAATKRLKRQVQKERRGAMRELRKDATFLDAEREKVRAQGLGAAKV